MMDLTALIQRTKELTGMYSADLVPDSLIVAWINETYHQINRQNTWPWATVPLADLVNPTDVPLFDDQFHTILAYGASVRTLSFVSDDTTRGEFYSNEFLSLLSDMNKFYLSGEALGQYSTAQNLIDLVRDLTAVYDDDVVSDALLLRWVNDAYLELGRRNSWPWLPVSVLSFGSEPAFAEQFRHVLSYRVAVRVFALVGDESNRSEDYSQEYNIILADMEKFYLSGEATAVIGTKDDMIRLVRDLTGVYDKAVISDALVGRYIEAAYQELARRHNWDWLEQKLSTPIGSLVLSDDRYTLTLPHQTSIILDALLVGDNGNVYEMRRVPNMDVVEPDGSKAYYDVSYNGVVTIGPEQPADYEVKLRYLLSSVSLPTGSSSPAFDSQFNMILPYRAAVSVLNQVSPEDPRVELYVEEYSSLYEGMYYSYELSHDDRSFQVGEESLNTRRYYPWFRPS